MFEKQHRCTKINRNEIILASLLDSYGFAATIEATVCEDTSWDEKKKQAHIAKWYLEELAEEFDEASELEVVAGLALFQDPCEQQHYWNIDFCLEFNDYDRELLWKVLTNSTARRYGNQRRKNLLDTMIAESRGETHDFAVGIMRNHHDLSDLEDFFCRALDKTYISQYLLDDCNGKLGEIRGMIFELYVQELFAEHLRKHEESVSILHRHGFNRNEMRMTKNIYGICEQKEIEVSRDADVIVVCSKEHFMEELNNLSQRDDLGVKLYF